MRFRVDVRVQRGPHRSRWVAHDRVRPAKVQRMIDMTAMEIATHEFRTSMPRFTDLPEDDNGFVGVMVTCADKPDQEHVIVVTPIQETER